MFSSKTRIPHAVFLALQTPNWSAYLIQFGNAKTRCVLSIVFAILWNLFQKRNKNRKFFLFLKKKNENVDRYFWTTSFVHLPFAFGSSAAITANWKSLSDVSKDWRVRSSRRKDQKLLIGNGFFRQCCLKRYSRWLDSHCLFNPSLEAMF